MRNAAVVARWELRRTIGRKAFLISTATMPVLLAIAVLAVVLLGDRIGGAVAEASTPDAGDSYGLIDRAGALDGRDLPSNFTRFVDEAAARTAEAQGAIAGYFVVAADYEQSGAVRFVADDFGAFGEREGEARGVIRSVLLDALLQEHVAPEIAARIRQPVELRAEGLDGSPPEGAAADSSIDAVLPYAMAMAVSAHHLHERGLPLGRRERGEGNPRDRDRAVVGHPRPVAPRKIGRSGHDRAGAGLGVGGHRARPGAPAAGPVRLAGRRDRQLRGAPARHCLSAAWLPARRGVLRHRGVHHHQLQGGPAACDVCGVAVGRPP